MCTTNTAYVNLTNDTGHSGTFQIAHIYGGGVFYNLSQVTSIASGGTAANMLTVEYHTGLLCDGNDDWWIGFTLDDGTVGASCSGSADDPDDQCTMHPSDANTNMPFSISNSTFSMNMLSGNCSASVCEVDIHTAANSKRSKKAMK